MTLCPTCLAADTANDDSLATLTRWQAVKLSQARDALFPLQVALGAARDRIRELEDTVNRQNAALNRSRGAAS